MKIVEDFGLKIVILMKICEDKRYSHSLTQGFMFGQFQTNSKGTGPIVTELHTELSGVGETKICSNDRGHMTKLVITFIYGKNLQNAPFPQPVNRRS